MIHWSSHNNRWILKDAAGVAGNIFALGLFVSPIPTFQRIMRNRSTEHFSGLPYIYALLNCLITMWYGMPAVSSNNVLVMTVNAMGAAFQLVYIILFTACADKAKKNLVIRTRSVEFMPFYLSLSTFLMSTSFLMYGILNGDIFVFLPNGIGTLLGMTQLLLYCYYKSSGSESSREPLIESYS
ncbi:bidirectional sugar transporter SWEET2-like isoform X2 [Punica granatum]|uniref:Bidirectional sugar transporter SWEET2-like isoform X2 n=1 Tax=Punica granatum TaxID=22663 RepID=A0A6P8EPH4_PUNGR|nr:bidirectional sugar transporter SWEET2-like isoform X2 [Punica granatum]